MVKEVRVQAKIRVGVGLVWRSLTKDLKLIIPKIIPNSVKDVEVVEGDGGLGTVYLFNFGPDIKRMTYQKERITELDESVHRIALEVIEGGQLHVGFSYYSTIFQLSADGEEQTLVDITVAYESAIEDDAFASKNISTTMALLKTLENYLINVSS